MRAAVATLLGQLMAQPLHGPRITLLLSRLLPPGLVAAIQVTTPANNPLCCYLWPSASSICPTITQQHHICCEGNSPPVFSLPAVFVHRSFTLEVIEGVCG